jgi:hypothetical protein
VHAPTQPRSFLAIVVVVGTASLGFTRGELIESGRALEIFSMAVPRSNVHILDPEYASVRLR